jgi:hypothetical protein
LPTRFKYKKVQPSSYGLTVDEIFETPDKELNKKASVKKMAPYKHEKSELPPVEGKKRFQFVKTTHVPSENRLKYVKKNIKIANSMTKERIAAYGLDKAVSKKKSFKKKPKKIEK